MQAITFARVLKTLTITQFLLDQDAPELGYLIELNPVELSFNPKSGLMMLKTRLGKGVAPRIKYSAMTLDLM